MTESMTVTAQRDPAQQIQQSDYGYPSGTMPSAPDTPNAAQQQTQTGDVLYGRVSSLVVGDDSGNALDLSAFRFTFTVMQGNVQTPNTAEIRVYNLADSTARRIKKEFTQVVLSGGYRSRNGVIFKGSCKRIIVGRESSTDTYLHIQGADADVAYNFGTINVSLAAGSTAQDQINAVLAALAPFQVTAGYIPYAQLPQTKSARGTVLHGMTKDVLRDLCKTWNMSYTFDNGQLQLIPHTSYIPGQAIVLDPSSGLLDMPSQTINGVEGRSLLNPAIRLGRAVQIPTKLINEAPFQMAYTSQLQNENLPVLNASGLYRVLQVQHSGDTRGNPWYSDFICIGIDQTASPLSSVKYFG